jgi:hypothetical protein
MLLRHIIAAGAAILLAAVASAADQDLPALARAGDHEMVVWREGGRLRGSIAGREIDIAPSLFGRPAVAAGEESFLVVWHDDQTVLGTRFAFDGTPLDATPLLLLMDDWTLNSFGAPGIGFGGSRFAVAVATASRVRVVEVGEDGSVSAEKATPVVPGRYVREPKPLWNGSEMLVAYALVIPTLVTPQTAFYASVLVARLDDLDRATTVLDATFALDFRYAAAVGRDRLTFVWTRSFGGTMVTAAQTTLDGRFVVSSFTPIPATATARDLALAWDGATHLLAWSDSSTGRLLALRLDAAAQPLSAEPMVIDDRGTDLPALVAAPRGLRIAYVRHHGERRVVVRWIDSERRRRSVRH